MIISEKVAEVQQQVDSWRKEGLKIGLVPTMGFFHDGHLALMECAKKCSDKVITTLFVNPKQFGPNEDLDQYPKDLQRDIELAKGVGVDILFCPMPAEMYGEDYQTTVAVSKLSQGLCGKDREGHFDGVATVVTKLFNITKPHVAVFGQKDFQQLSLIKQLVSDLNFDIEIICHPIVRESDGLAMSSRNKYLDAKERATALCLYETLIKAKELYKQHNGNIKSSEIEQLAYEVIEADPSCVIDYAQVIHRNTLRPTLQADADSVLVLAVKINNKVRLLDNTILEE